MVTDSRRLYTCYVIVDTNCHECKYDTMVLGIMRYRIMKLKRKIHKDRIRTFTKNNGILNTLRCTAKQIKAEL